MTHKHDDCRCFVDLDAVLDSRSPFPADKGVAKSRDSHSPVCANDGDPAACGCWELTSCFGREVHR